MTARSLPWLKANGYIAQKVERWQKIWNPKPGGLAGVRIDLFGIIDIVAMPAVAQANGSILGVQSTSAQNYSEHERKCLESPNLALWLHSGADFEIHSWRKGGASGKRKLWNVKRMRAKLHGDSVVFFEYE